VTGDILGVTVWRSVRFISVTIWKSETETELMYVDVRA